MLVGVVVCFLGFCRASPVGRDYENDALTEAGGVGCGRDKRSAAYTYVLEYRKFT